MPIRYCGLIFLCSLCFLGCNDFPESTPHGFRFRYHRQEAEKLAQIGDEVYVQFQIRTEEQTLFESPNGIEGLRTVLPDPELNPIKDPDPIADVLPLMGVGDSVTVIMPVSEDMRVAFGLEDAERIYYDVVIRHIGPLEERTPSEDASLEAKANEAERRRIAGELLAKVEPIEAAQTALTTLYKYVDTAKGTSNSAALFSYELIRAGDKKAASGEKVLVRHIGMRADSLMISEAFSEQPFQFTVGQGQVIKAWEEAVKLMGYGGAILMEVPPALAYGATGKLPLVEPTDTLYYYMELVAQ